MKKETYTATSIPKDEITGLPLVRVEEVPFVDFESLVVSSDTRERLDQVVKEFRHQNLFATYNLQPKKRVLLYGEQGTGKTLSAQTIACALTIPLVHIKLDTVISACVGDSINNLQKVFDFMKSKTFVVLFHAFDVVGGDIARYGKSGELYKLVNNFLQMFDAYSGDGILIAESNHSDLFIDRDFDEILYFDLPDEKERQRLFILFMKSIKRSDEIDFIELAEVSTGLSPSDIKMAVVEALKISILEGRAMISMEDIENAVERFMLNIGASFV